MKKTKTQSDIGINVTTRTIPIIIDTGGEVGVKNGPLISDMTGKIERSLCDPTTAAIPMLEKDVIVVTDRGKKSYLERQIGKDTVANIWARAENGNVSEGRGVICNLRVPERI
jgi:hypothetical protein